MKHILFSIFIALSFFCTATAQKTTAEQQKAVAAISRAAAQTTSIAADFVQTKTLRMLGDKMVANGRMEYRRQGGRLKWEYLKPYSYVFLLEGDRVTLTKGKRTDVIDVNRNKMFKEIARIMMNSMLGTCITDTKTFKVTVSADASQYAATLIPQKKEMKQMFSRIVLHFNRQNAMVTRVMMYEHNGDCTDIVLKNVKSVRS